MKKLLRKLWNTWRMPKDGEFVDIFENDRKVINVRCHRVENFHRWDFSKPMVLYDNRWQKITRDGSVGHPSNGVSWKFPNGV